MLPIKTKNNIRKIVFTSFCCILIVCGKAQNFYSNLDLNSTSTNFNLNSANSLETQQVIAQAFKISVISWLSNYLVYARVYSSSASTATPIPASLLGIKLRSVSPSNSKANYSTIHLSSNNQLIITSSSTSLFATHVWTYDMVLEPIGYNIMPGAYNFTVLFTMTQP